jgi:hypothetical protein
VKVTEHMKGIIEEAGGRPSIVRISGLPRGAMEFPVGPDEARQLAGHLYQRVQVTITFSVDERQGNTGGQPC